MDNLLDDVALQRNRLMRQFLEAESASLNHLDQVESVHAKVAAVWSKAAEAESGSLGVPVELTYLWPLQRIHRILQG